MKAWKRRVWERSGGVCAMCRIQCTRTGGNEVTHGTVDHIVPKRLGGGNHWRNLQLLCLGCHREKDQQRKGGRFRRLPRPVVILTQAEAFREDF